MNCRIYAGRPGPRTQRGIPQEQPVGFLTSRRLEIKCEPAGVKAEFIEDTDGVFRRLGKEHESCLCFGSPGVFIEDDGLIYMEPVRTNTSAQVFPWSQRALV